MAPLDSNGKPNVCFKFEFTAGPDNNLYVDDIEVTGNFVGMDELYRNNLDLTIYPNPSNSNTNISFSLAKKVLTEISLFDITGREVKKIKNEMLEVGAHSYLINTGKLSRGVYFVKLKAGDVVDVKKMIVE